MKNSKFVIDKLAKLFEKGLVSSKDIANELMKLANLPKKIPIGATKDTKSVYTNKS